jgi:hypothetical protein
MRQGICAGATPEEYQQRHQVTTCSRGKVAALIFHDSFFTGSMKPFFADYFSTTVFLWERLNQDLMRKNIAVHRPALVMEELAERFLPYIPDISGETYPGFWQGIYDRSSEVYRLAGGKIGKGDVSNATVQDRRDGTLELEALNADPHVHLPDAPFKPDQLYILKVRIAAPAATQMQIFYSRRGEEGVFPAERDSWKHSLQKGDNTLFIPLLSGDLAPRLRLDPGMVQGRYAISEFAIRRIDKTSLQ